MKHLFRILAVFLLLFSAAAITSAASAFREGDEGRDVAQIQAKLNDLGYSVSVDGEFGAGTTAAIIAFQKDRGLEADGLVGDTTYRTLMGRDIPASRSDAGTSMARRIVQTALRLNGVPYAFGGTTPYGFDCSGYVRYVFSGAGISLPRMADEQYSVGRAVSEGSLQPGDLVFYTTYDDGPSHVGIYLGGRNFIHASSSRGVVVDSMDGSYWLSRYYGARRVL